KFCIFNEQYSESEYRKKFADLYDGSFSKYAELKNQAQQFFKNFIVKSYHGYGNEKVSGEYLYQCKDVRNSFAVTASEDSKYLQLVQTLPGAKDSYDYTVWGGGAELMYESVECGDQVYDIKFSKDIYPNCSRIEYSAACVSSTDLFGCVGLKKKQYCILNKQYSKDEYLALVRRIKEHMEKMPYIDKLGRSYGYGEHLPPEFSLFGYNESMANDYFPLSKEAAQELGYNWYDPPEKNLKIDIKAEELSRRVAEAGADLPKKVISCADSGRCSHQCAKAFKILPQELDFYKKMNLPLPRLCSFCRLSERFALRNKLIFKEGICACAGLKSKAGTYSNLSKHAHGATPCQNQFVTTYDEKKNIVYCEDCYREEVE
ncbi:MAG: hypothetical protein V1821_01660, partial [bacterium]